MGDLPCRIESKVDVGPPVAPFGGSSTDQCVDLWQEYYRAYCLFVRSGREGGTCDAVCDHVGRSGLNGVSSSVEPGGIRHCRCSQESRVVENSGGIKCGSCDGSLCSHGEQCQSCGCGQRVATSDEVSVDDQSKSGMVALCVANTKREPTVGSSAQGGVELVKGPNWARNVKNRAEQKARKLKRKSMGVDWRKRDGGDIVKQDDAPGAFWNSTSKETRQQLIDSKAKMHIAENQRREREALDKIAYYDSPEAAMHKAVAMIEYAQKQAKKDKDSRVFGWAHTVASASAESLARSTPDSVPSFDELSAKLEASSQSSFELEVKAKQDELDAKDVKIKQLEAEARIQKNLAEMRGKQAAEKVEQEKHAAVVKRMNELEAELKRSSKHLPDWYKNMDRDRARNRAIGLC